MTSRDRNSVVITGGAGFLGEHVCAALEDTGRPIKLFDVLPAPSWATRHGYAYYQGDIRDSEAVEKALSGAEIVIHAAFAPPYVPPSQMEAINVQAFERLCLVARRSGVRRLVAISSTIVTKPPRRHRLLKRAALNRLEAYRMSRVRVEEIAAAQNGQGLSTAVVRPKTFVGPNRVSALALVFDLIRRGQPVPLLGRGENRYQMLDIRDMASGIALLTQSDARGVFCFGAERFGTVKQDLQGLISHAATGARLFCVSPFVARGAVRAVELLGLPPLSEWHHMSAAGRDSIVDIARARSELGWRPRYSNVESLIASYESFLERCVRGEGAKTTHPIPRSHRWLLHLGEWIWR